MEKNPTMMPVVAAALIKKSGTICLQKRPENKAMPGLWEFPGGKVEHGELPEAALARELHEELDVGVDPADFVPLTFATAPIGDRTLLLLLYACHRWEREARAVESPELRWVETDQMTKLAMPSADGPFIPALANYLQQLRAGRA
ncbi:MAG: (deoxy)nucleoside triphosphate pyrophosphohydrolase [Sphingorhabdus sp.]